MDADDFVGTWRLVSWELRDAAGTTSYPFGRQALGYLLYTRDGYMSVTLMRADRPRFAAADILGGALSEQAGAAATYIAYAGPYRVWAETVVHHVEVSLFPNWIGTEQERYYAFAGDRLTLSTAPLLVAGHEQRAYLVWERVAGSA
jgi:hypothetical protein